MKKITKEIVLILILAVIATASIFKISFLHELVFTHPLISAVVSGFFLVSVFTVVPATAVVATLSLNCPIMVIAPLAAIGATAGNFFMLNFFESFLIDFLGKSIRKTVKKAGLLLKFIGVLVWVLPVPDEIPMAILGVSKTRFGYFLAMSIVINFLTVLNIALIAKGIR